MGSIEDVKTEELDDPVENESNNHESSENEEKESKKGPYQTFLRMLSNTIPIIMFGLFGSFLANSFILGDKYVEKKAINSEITTLIKNGAGLRAVKFHYDHRESVKRDIFFYIKHDVSLYYKYEIALSEILEKLRTEQFLKGNTDPEFLQKLDAIITEYTESNPFDKLEAGQKDLFENIRVKLNGNYSIVSDDVNKLSDELSNKNKLVNEYLSDSQTSLIVSIVSAFIAVLLAGVQMWQNKSKSMLRVPNDRSSIARTEFMSENENGEKVRTVHYSDGRVMEKTYTKDGIVVSQRSSYS